MLVLNNLVQFKEPSIFVISCLIGNINIGRVSYDLSFSVSLMPCSIFKKLDLGELIPTTTFFQLMDRYVMSPLGTLEDPPIIVDDFMSLRTL